MATSITRVSDEIAEYLSRNFSAEDQFLRELRAEAAAEGIPAINISGEQGSFLQLLLRAMNARTVVEIGSLAGYSAILMARALGDGGKVICMELNADYCEFIQRKASEAGLSEKIDVRCGAALDLIEALDPSDKIDFVFIDADKPNYSNYLRAVLPMVRTGGIICGDNTLAWGEIANPHTEFEPQNVHALQEFNRNVYSNPSFARTLVPLGDGMTLAYKLG